MATTDHGLGKGTAALQFPAFRLYLMARFCTVFCAEMKSVAVGWPVYEITRKPLDLGLTGLVQFLPGLLLFLVTGHVADRFDRRKLWAVCYAGYALSSALLWAVTVHQGLLYRAGSVALIGISEVLAAACLVAVSSQVLAQEPPWVPRRAMPPPAIAL